MSGATLARRRATLAVVLALLFGRTAAAQSSRLEGGVSSHPGLSRIAPGQTAFNLYVLFQPGWTPLYPHANVDVFRFGAADRVDLAVKK